MEQVLKGNKSHLTKINYDETRKNCTYFNVNCVPKFIGHLGATAGSYI